MRKPVLLDRILKRACDVSLSYESVERLRPVFARENLVTHVPNLVRRHEGENRKQIDSIQRMNGLKMALDRERR